MKRALLPFTLLAAVACSSESTEPSVGLVSHDPDTAARAAGLTASKTITIAGDVGQLVAGTFNLHAGISIDTMPPVGTIVDLDHDLTTPGGRHVQGSLHVALSNACSPFGLEVDYHLLIESDPQSGEMLSIDGTVKLAIGRGTLDLSVSLEQLATADSHSVQTSVNVCLMLDAPSRHVAMNGHVLVGVDNQDYRGVRIEDVRAVLCEPLPYQGSVIVEDPDHDISVVFDQGSPDTRVVTVQVDGNTSRTELDVQKIVEVCDDIFGPASLPQTIDYASCGGCGQPPPKSPPAGNGTGTNTGSGGPDL